MSVGRDDTSAHDEAGGEVGYISDPLSHLRSVHNDRRQRLGDLDKLCEPGQFDSEVADRLLTYFQQLLPIHDADEWEDLLPLLRRRAEGGAGLGDLLCRLKRDLEASRSMLGGVCALLSRPGAGGAPLSDEERLLLRDFARAERRLLLLKNAIILPLSQARLTKEDLRSLAIRMAMRRGLCLVPLGGGA